MPHSPPDEPTAPHRPPPPPVSPQEEEAWREKERGDERGISHVFSQVDDMREALDRSIEDNNRDINTTPLWRVCRLWAYYVQDATLQRLKAALAEQQETRDR